MSGMASYRVEAICWDHDKFTKKDYLGETSVNLKRYFERYPAKADSASPHWYGLTSFRKGRRSSVVSGAIELKIWLESRGNADASEAELQAAWMSMAKAIESLEGADIALGAPDRPVGMQSMDDEDSDVDVTTHQSSQVDGEEEVSDLDSVLAGDSDLDNFSESDLHLSSESQEVATAAKMNRRQRRAQRKQKKLKPFHFKTSQAKDVLGVVFLEIDSAKDLPRERNLTKTGFDMDPFVITSFSKKTFRTKVVRHSLNPVFHDKLLLQVHRHEDQYDLKFTVVDRDKLSGNDYVGDCSLPIQDLIKAGPQADPETGLFMLNSAAESCEPEHQAAATPRKKLLGIRRLTRQLTGGGMKDLHISSGTSTTVSDSDTDTKGKTHERGVSSPSNQSAQLVDSMQELVLPLNLVRKEFWGEKFHPTLTVKAKFVPYPALRQQFWRVLLRYYDVDETNDITRVELTTMLDSLGATLKDSTIDSFFTRFGKGRLNDSEGELDIDGNPMSTLDDTLTIDQCVICLEDQLSKLNGKRPTLSSARSASTSTLTTLGTSSRAISRPPSRASVMMSSNSLFNTTPVVSAPPTSVPQSSTSQGGPSKALNASQSHLSATDSLNSMSSEGTPTEDDSQEEYLISLTQCPLCKKSNMDKRSNVDIVTHLATCASQDWRKVDTLLMGDFVTSSQAQRKWYTKIISKVGYGGYKLGANSANILVQDRKTGQVEEERMSVYVRLGIRLLYKGMKSSRMETTRIKRMLKSMSVKQGRKYDAPSSAKDIPAFIAFHQLKMTEVLDPIDSFKSFNEFFYRKLKEGARPCAQPEDQRIAVSPADCRSVVFNSISDATEIWIKGQNFSLQRLFGTAYPGEVERFVGGSLGIFRLAPQDYHRFHIPVDGVLGQPKALEGQYYTVNPMAIRSNLDVYGENVRVLVPIDSKEFGRVMIVCIGAMMVGSTVITASTGQKVARTDELGYFKFGGSTLLVIFEPGRFVFDEDLTQNSKLSIETLLCVGSSIGHPPGMQDAPNESSDVTTEQDKRDATRRIAGQMAHPDQSAAQKTKEMFSSHNAM